MRNTLEQSPWLLNLLCSIFLAGSFYIVISCGGDAASAPAMESSTPDMTVTTDADSMDSSTPDMTVTTDAGTADASPSTDQDVVIDGGMGDASIPDDTSVDDPCLGMVVTSDADLARYTNCEIITGPLSLTETSISDLTPLSMVREITGLFLLRDNESLTDLSPLSNLTKVGGLSLDSNDALINLSGLMSLTEVTGDLAVTWSNGLRDISALNQLETVTGTLSIFQNPVLCQVMVNHFIDPIKQRNPGLSLGSIDMNGYQESTCDPLCPMTCMDGDECYGDIEVEDYWCLDLCRDVTDCSSSAFCRPAEGCPRIPGCQDGQPCAEQCAQVCISPNSCTVDTDCREAYYCEPMCEDCPGSCRPRCDGPLDCGSRQVCIEQRCTDACVPGSCREREVCVVAAGSETGRCLEGCYVDSDCGPEATCIGANLDNNAWGTCEFTEPPTDCMAPRTINEGRYAGDLEMAPGQLESSCGGEEGSPETVFLYQPSMSGMICVDTRGSQGDTVLYIRSGACAGEGCSEVACNDDDNGVTSSLRFQADAGQDYFIVVDSWSRGRPFTLNIQPCEDDMPIEPREPSMCQ